MWTSIAHIILKFRLPLIIVIIAITGFMVTQMGKVKWSYDLASIVPPTDPEMIYFKKFKETFGEDGNIMALGILDSSIYSIQRFQEFKYLLDELKSIKGVNNVLGLPNIQALSKNKERKQFELKQPFADFPKSQRELDSILAEISKIKFYSGQLINESNGATLVLITVDKKMFDSKNRAQLFDDIMMTCQAFEKVTGIDLRYAGLPYTRATTTGKVKKELNMFLMLSLAITALILFLFFRAGNAVLVPMIIIVIIVVWTIGTLGLLGYKITLLTGLIPPIIVVIGIPNSVYMLNRYHQELARHGNKIKALSTITRKIGIVTLITNTTTAVGFLVLATTQITILKEFGIVAGINIMATFFVSVILIPAFYSYFPQPKSGHLKHLNFKIVNYFIEQLDVVVHRHKYIVFAVTAIIAAFSLVGLLKIKAVSFMVDDLPDDSETIQDLRFFEHNFSGIMPLEVVVNTGNKRGIRSIKNLRKIDEFEQFMNDIPYISQPVSVVSLIKAARQAYYNNNPAFYSIPTSRDIGFIFRYLSEDVEKNRMSASFIDEDEQTIRISFKVADIGSSRMDSLVNLVVRPKIEEIFGETKMETDITGTTLIFIKGNQFLINNLIQSMIIAFVIIAFIMAILFRNFRMIVISLIPNMIPLLMTAGIMGYFGIPLKPSTALIFSIAFGISVDDSIHFLAKYRQELFANNFFVPVALHKSIQETGASMIYTSIILFFGFVIFTLSEFGGTIALGLLTSMTLFFAMLTNLIVLPALLLRFDTGKRRTDIHPLIEEFDEFYHEDEDEEINLEQLKMDKV